MLDKLSDCNLLNVLDKDQTENRSVGGAGWQAFRNNSVDREKYTIVTRSWRSATRESPFCRALQRRSARQ